MVVHVVDATDDTPLVNAEVIDRGTGARALTRDRGTAQVHVTRADALSLRVRQLGFAFVDRTLDLGEILQGGADTIHVRLQRVAYALPSVSTTTNSEKLVFVSSRVTRGWQPTLDNYKKSYPNRAAMGTLTFSDLEITVLSKDSAVVLGSWSLKREKDNPGGKFTLIFRKFKDGWKIVHDHTS